MADAEARKAAIKKASSQVQSGGAFVRRAQGTTDGEIAVAAHKQRCTGRWCDGVIFHPPAGGQTAMTTNAAKLPKTVDVPHQKQS